jgi:hypothetical protein
VANANFGSAHVEAVSFRKGLLNPADFSEAFISRALL